MLRDFGSTGRFHPVFARKVGSEVLLCFCFTDVNLQAYRSDGHHLTACFPGQCIGRVGSAASGVSTSVVCGVSERAKSVFTGNCSSTGHGPDTCSCHHSSGSS